MKANATNQDHARELAEKLAGFVDPLRKSGLFTYRDIATAMMAIGVEIARQDQGGVQAAEWLRGIADEIERPDLNGRPQ